MALLALAMLSFATVRSVVMQAAMVSSDAITATDADEATPPMSGMMPGMDMADDRMAAMAPAGHHKPDVPDHKGTCPYCAAAAHLPVGGHVAVPRGVAAMVFVSFHLTAARGPRGPPRFEHRARGPPTDPEPA